MNPNCSAHSGSELADKIPTVYCMTGPFSNIPQSPALSSPPGTELLANVDDFITGSTQHFQKKAGCEALLLPIVTPMDFSFLAIFRDLADSLF
jgi:hypothetical protein